MSGECESCGEHCLDCTCLGKGLSEIQDQIIEDSYQPGPTTRTIEGFKLVYRKPDGTVEPVRDLFDPEFSVNLKDRNSDYWKKTVQKYRDLVKEIGLDKASLVYDSLHWGQLHKDAFEKAFKEIYPDE